MQELENDGPNRRAGKWRTWKMTDHITVLVLVNTYFYHGENSFTGALSSKFSSIEITFVWCSQTLNITFRRGSQTYAKTHISGIAYITQSYLLKGVKAFRGKLELLKLNTPDTRQIPGNQSFFSIILRRHVCMQIEFKLLSKSTL